LKTERGLAVGSPIAVPVAARDTAGKPILGLALAVLVLVSQPLGAQTGAAVEIERRQMRFHPSLELGLAVKIEAVHVGGGVDPGWSTLANLDLLLDLDTERAGWWHGGKLHFYGLADAGSGPSPSQRAGDLQTLRNLESPDDFKLYEAYLEQRIGAATTLSLGLHDMNTVFADMATASLFHHSSFGIQPDVSQTGPSIFPTTALGAVLTSELPRDLLLEAGVYDGVPGDPAHPRGTHVRFGSHDGLYSIAQLTWRQGGGIDGGGADWAIAAWTNSARFADPAGRERESNWGGYSTYERQLWNGGAGADLSGFAQLGWAQGDRNGVERYFGAGLVWTSPFPHRRPADRLGFAVGNAALSRIQRDVEPGLPGAEWAFELTYSAVLARGVVLEPDIQYVRHPAAQPGARDARVMALRLVFGI
jgi:porin